MLTMTKSPLSTATVTAVLPVVDGERARRFYGEVLGLEVTPVTGQNGYLMASAGSGTSIMLYPRGEATKAEHTVASFSVSGLESVVAELRSRGVVFEEYDLPGLRTVRGIATMGSGKSAWFKDTEGNILAVSER